MRSPTVTPKLQRIAAQAACDPHWAFTTLAHLIDEDFLREAYRHTSKSSAAGIDAVTAQSYAKHLDENLRDLQVTEQRRELAAFGVRGGGCPRRRCRLRKRHHRGRLGGWLVQALTAPIAVLVDAISFMVSAACLGVIQTPEPAAHDRTAPQTTWLAIRESLRLVLHDPVLRALAGARTTLSFFLYLWLSMLLLFLTRGLGLEPVVFGVLFAVGGICSLVGATLAERVVRWHGLCPTLILTLCITSAGLLLVPLAVGPFVWVVVLVRAQQLADGPATIYQIHETSLIQATVAARSLGRVTASLRVVGWIAMLGGTSVGGLLGEALGPRPMPKQV